MSFSIRSRRLAVVAGLAAAGLAVAAVPAHASGPSGNGSINATAVVGSTLTLTLSASSFSVNAPAGQSTDTNGGGTGLSATVATNDVAGYQLDEQIPDPHSGIGRFNGTVGGNVLMGNYISAYTYTGVGVLGSSPAAFSNPGYLGLYATTAASSASGDVYPLKWNFAPPASTPADSYSGQFQLLAAGN